jgi:hypothetical protein
MFDISAVKARVQAKLSVVRHFGIYQPTEGRWDFCRIEWVAEIPARVEWASRLMQVLP